MTALELRRAALLTSVLLSAACGDEPIQLAIPRIGTNYVVIGAAGGGRALADRDLRIVRSAEVTTLEIPGSGNADVDMLFAGIREEDLPAGYAPEDIQFVSLLEENSRPMPPLFLPHVLAVPSPPGTEGVLVPVEEATASEDDRVYRRERLRLLLSKVGILDPCTDGGFEFSTPRIPAAGVPAVRYLTGGDAIFGLTATGTAILGRIATGQRDLRLIGVATGDTPVMPGEALAIVTLGSAEVADRGGQSMPRDLAMLRGNALAVIARFDAATNAYVDETPRELDVQPEVVRTFQELSIDGAQRLCMAGSVLGQGSVGSGSLAAGIWCKNAGGGPWEKHSTIIGANFIRLLVEQPGGDVLAIDYSGTVHTYLGQQAWRKTAVPDVNQNCGTIACRRMDVVLPLAGGGERLAFMAGDDGLAFVARDNGAGVRVEATHAVGAALFADERTGEGALDFFAGAQSPDGAVWLGSRSRLLVRVSPDLTTAERVCLPSTIGDHPVTAIAAAASGELLVSTSPPVVGLSTWQRP
ncbi:MAG: hypothetical protein IT384_30145 [Deltaproteobacteria bacterium]|nr:hypothetical protein [Deltaproteobacteria bacterium]